MSSSSTPSSQTATAHEPAPGAEAAAEPHLFIVVEGARLDAGGARIRLAPFAAVAVGRARRRAIEAGDDGREVALSIPDPLMSSRHARIDRDLEGWQVRDLGSKNGTTVNGLAVDRRRLVDGDVIGVGHTLLRYREVAAAPGEAIAEVDPASRALGLATLLPELAGDFDKLRAMAATDVAILISGPSGSGKELTAGAIHRLSGRPGELVAVNCGALPPGLVESQLFGHRRGSFSGADRDAVGLIRSADGSTLLLDEIGDLGAPAQAALLRTLESGEVLPVGATRAERVDFRLICATHRDLDAMVEAGEFRGDLLARISGYRVELPPLSERVEDLGELVARAVAAVPELAGARLSRSAALRLVDHEWRHNARELVAAIRSAAVLAGDGPIEVDHLPRSIREAGALEPEDRRRRDQLVALLREHGGNVSAVARALDKARMQIQRWLKRYAIDPADYR